MEEDFYATIKFKNGEEIFAKVMVSEESEKTFLLLSNPVICTQVKNKSEIVGYKVEPWLKTTHEDMFIVNVDDILTISESFDIDMISMHQSYTRQTVRENNNQSKISKEMGYISNVNDAKEILEKIFKEY